MEVSDPDPDKLPEEKMDRLWKKKIKVCLYNSRAELSWRNELVIIKKNLWDNLKQGPQNWKTHWKAWLCYYSQNWRWGTNYAELGILVSRLYRLLITKPGMNELLSLEKRLVPRTTIRDQKTCKEINIVKTRDTRFLPCWETGMFDAKPSKVELL